MFRERNKKYLCCKKYFWENEDSIIVPNIEFKKFWLKSNLGPNQLLSIKKTIVGLLNHKGGIIYCGYDKREQKTISQKTVAENSIK